MDMELPIPPPETDNTIIDHVFSSAGIELYSFLAPRDLVSLSLINRQSLADVRENLFDICSRQRRELSPAVEAGEASMTATTSVAIHDTHSYVAKEDLADTLVKKIKAENLRYNIPGCLTPVDTLGETLSEIKGDLCDESRWFDGAWYGNFKSDPAEIWKPHRTFSAGCRFGEDGQRGCGRRCFVDYMLHRMDRRDCNEATMIARDWSRYIVAQKHVVGREWQWKCDLEEGVGFMIYTPSGQELEIRLIKKTESQPQCILPPPPSLLSAFGL